MSTKQDKKINDGQGLAQAIYAQLRQDIISGKIPPGTRISERGLTAQFPGSRTPIREAIRTLAAEGWVRASPRSGTMVLPIDPADSVEIYQLRMALEPLALELAIAKMDAEQDAFIMRSLESLKAATDQGNRSIFTEIDVKLHLKFAEWSGSKRLFKAIQGLTVDIKRLGSKALLHPDRAATTLAEISKLSEAVLQRNPFEAKHRLIEHLMSSRDMLLVEIREGKA